MSDYGNVTPWGGGAAGSPEAPLPFGNRTPWQARVASQAAAPAAGPVPPGSPSYGPTNLAGNGRPPQTGWAGGKSPFRPLPTSSAPSGPSFGPDVAPVHAADMRAAARTPSMASRLGAGVRSAVNAFGGPATPAAAAVESAAGGPSLAYRLGSGLRSSGLNFGWTPSVAAAEASSPMFGWAGRAIGGAQQAIGGAANRVLGQTGSRMLGKAIAPMGAVPTIGLAAGNYALGNIETPEFAQRYHALSGAIQGAADSAGPIGSFFGGAANIPIRALESIGGYGHVTGKAMLGDTEAQQQYKIMHDRGNDFFMGRLKPQAGSTVPPAPPAPPSTPPGQHPMAAASDAALAAHQQQYMQDYDKLNGAPNIFQRFLQGQQSQPAPKSADVAGVTGQGLGAALESRAARALNAPYKPTFDMMGVEANSPDGVWQAQSNQMGAMAHNASVENALSQYMRNQELTNQGQQIAGQNQASIMGAQASMLGSQAEMLKARRDPAAMWRDPHVMAHAELQAQQPIGSTQRAMELSKYPGLPEFAANPNATFRDLVTQQKGRENDQVLRQLLQGLFRQRQAQQPGWGEDELQPGRWFGGNNPIYGELQREFRNYNGR